MKKAIVSLSLVAGGVLILMGSVFYLWPERIAWLWRGAVRSTGLVTVQYVVDHPSVRVQNAKIVAEEQYTLAFPFAGKIASISAQEGQSFTQAGQVLIQMEKTEWELELKKTEAGYNESQAIVRRLEQGARFEELLILEQKKQSSESALKGSKKETLDALVNAFVQSDDAVHSKTDSIYTTPSTHPTLIFTPAESGLKSRLESKRDDLEDLLGDWKDDTDDMKDSGDVSRYLSAARKKLETTREYLDLVAEAVNGLAAGAVTQETIDAWKEAVSAARTQVAEVTIVLGGTESAYQVANKNVSIAKGELDYRLAGTAKQDIEAALSSAAAARSQMDIIADKLRQTTLLTPLPGLLVKKILPQSGEYVQAGEPVVILDNPTLEVEADVPEEKIVGIAVGNRVIMRLNAYPEKDFLGTIRQIEPQEIEKDGGTYFRVRATLQNLESDSLRTGMLGDAIIATMVKGGVVRIPVQAAGIRDGRYVVRVLENGKEQQRVIETGMEIDGFLEVLSGLQAGDQIIPTMSGGTKP